MKNLKHTNKDSRAKEQKTKSRNMFWKLTKNPQQLYGKVLPSVIG